MVKSAIRPLLLLATVIAGGCAPPLSLVDRPCPCGTGFTCCAASNVCVRDGDACGGPATNAPMAYVL
ncbi:MAG TPA: hypothetical protein VFH73_15300, partial [Polyangia bacterium]|nr:hypothetical protein [Polyangia bacterium]